MLLLLLSFGLLLSGCGRNNEAADARSRELRAQEIADYFTRQGLEMHSVEVQPENVFQRELNGRKPLVFLLDEKELVIYQFATAGEREEGWADFENKTAAADLVTHKVYQEQSLLIFYLYDDGTVAQVLYRQVEKLIPGLLKFRESGT
ncbi:hypothetical protein D3C75_923100 [compost metagenome]